jgi:hypothetical protein
MRFFWAESIALQAPQRLTAINQQNHAISSTPLAL